MRFKTVTVAKFTKNKFASWQSPHCWWCIILILVCFVESLTTLCTKNATFHIAAAYPWCLMSTQLLLNVQVELVRWSVCPEWPLRQCGGLVLRRFWVRIPPTNQLFEFAPFKRRLRGTAQSIGSQTASQVEVCDCIVRIWLWSTATGTCTLGYFIRHAVDNWLHKLCCALRLSPSCLFHSGEKMEQQVRTQITMFWATW